MNKLRVGVLYSGKGTTVKSICEAVKNDILNINLCCVISNCESVLLQKPGYENISSYYSDQVITEGILYENIKNYENREAYLSKISNHLNAYNLDLIIFAGWNLIVNKTFIDSNSRIINLHPSLPNTFVGENCIRKAFDAFTRGEIKYTGSMVHEVTEEVDKGKVLNQIIVPIYDNDTYDSLETRQKQMEKGILIQTIQDIVNEHNLKLTKKVDKPYIGKVRRVEDIGYGCLLLSASNRLSSFDKHICDIKNKGNILNNISAWWFRNTSHIIDNHYLFHSGNDMIVKKADPIKLEVIVRAYMTGSTNTSIWTMYKNGDRNIYGLEFRDGYKKNEKLDQIIITPTTKGVVDRPITSNEIIDLNYLTSDQWDYISKNH